MQKLLWAGLVLQKCAGVRLKTKQNNNTTLDGIILVSNMIIAPCYDSWAKKVTNRSNKYEHCTSFHHRCLYLQNSLLSVYVMDRILGHLCAAFTSWHMPNHPIQFIACCTEEETVQLKSAGQIKGLFSLHLSPDLCRKKKKKNQRPDRIRQMCLGYGYLVEAHSPISHIFTNTSKTIHRSGHNRRLSKGRESTGHQVQREESHSRAKTKRPNQMINDMLFLWRDLCTVNITCSIIENGIVLCFPEEA